MCHFISAVKMPTGKYKFLTGYQLFRTKHGQELVKTISLDDWCGHGTIREYYHLAVDEGEDYEFTNFSSPDNFPPDIVRAIKDGKMKGFDMPKELLTAPADKAWQEATATADKAYQEAIAPADKAWQEAKATADKAWQEAKAPAYKAWQEAKATAWDLFAIPENRVEAWR